MKYRMPRVIKYSVMATHTVCSTARPYVLGVLFLLVTSPAFGFGALIARTNISITGNVLADSFDPSDPNHSTNGNYDPSKRKDGGNLVLTENLTNAAITLTEAVTQSIAIYGRVLLGSESNVVQLGTPPSIGSTNWIDTGNVGIQPGWVVQYPGFFLWDAPTPPTGGLPFPIKGTYALMGTNHTNSYLLSFGNYQIGNLSLTSSEKILVKGHIKLFVTGNLTMSGQSQILIATNSSLTLYAGGRVDLSGGGVINHPRFATNLVFNGLNTCTDIQYTGGADLIGTIYAPKPSVKMSGGGSTTYHLDGTVVANTITINGHYQIHFDERLFRFNPAAALSFPAITAGGAIQFQVAGVPGEYYVIEASTNLMDWLPVTTNQAPFTFTNSSASAPQEFFRATYSLPSWWH